MNVTVFDGILDRFVRTTLVPQMKNTLNRFMVGAALGAGSLRAESMRPQLKALGVMHDSEIDTVKLGAALRGGFEQAPEVSVFGFRFSKDDAEALIRELNVQGQIQQAQPAAPPVQTP